MSGPGSPRVSVGFRCATCGSTVDLSQETSWRCPNATGADRAHVLSIVTHEAAWDVVVDESADNPFLAYRPLLAWDAFAASHGLTEAARIATIAELDAQVAQVAQVGFRRTPCTRADRLSDALGFSAAGGVWVKDETANVAGSHKARHLFSILLHLVTLERLGRIGERRPLAIASCGNAALAAATLAAAVSWPIRVFVPPSAASSVLDRLADLRAEVVLCPRRADDPPGDPCVHRFREAVAAGAVPFAVQGPENAWCLDSGRSIGWELASAHLDRVVMQVGGGAFVACVGAGLRDASSTTIVDAVQTQGCAPLERAWRLAGEHPDGRQGAGRHWRELMWPWESEPSSLADGILDDETYDWLGAFAALDGTGTCVVSPESDVVAAYELSRSTTTIPASATGTAGLAGVLTMRRAGQIRDDERVGVVFSGVQRSTVPGA